jgi:hypothetical protein
MLRQDLPSPRKVVSRVLCRAAADTSPDLPSKNSMLWLNFVMWFTHNLFQSSSNPALRYTQASLHGGDTLRHLYGRTQRQRAQQRIFTNGQLHVVSKVKSIYGVDNTHLVSDGLLAERPDGISDEQFSEFFVSSLSRANAHPGNYFMDHIFRSLHNAICVAASVALPEWAEWTEDRRYLETRIVCSSLVWDIVIDDYILYSYFGIKRTSSEFRNMGGPGLWRSFTKSLGNTIHQSPNIVTVSESWNLLGYRFGHLMQPAKMTVKDREFDFTNPASYARCLTEDPREIRDVLKAFAQTPCKAIAVRSTPDFLKSAEIANLRSTRIVARESINTLRTTFGLPPHRTFLDLARGDRTTETALKSVYSTVDDVDAYIGIACETQESNGKGLWTKDSVVLHALMSVALVLGPLTRGSLADTTHTGLKQVALTLIGHDERTSLFGRIVSKLYGGDVTDYSFRVASTGDWLVQ